MKVKEISSLWLYRVERRLDGKPYVSEGFEARQLIAKWKGEKNPLEELTNGENGIFIAPYFKRIYVEDLEYGIPMLGNADIMMANPTLTASLLSQKVVNAYPDQLSLKEGWTLVTCFGTVGNSVYVRKDMESCVGSTNFMRIIPDPQKISPGYLYAFLSSKFGRALFTQSETGSVIPNLLPSQVASLPIPRFGKNVEGKINDLVKEAAEYRSKANALRSQVVRKVENYLKWQSVPIYNLSNRAFVSELGRRLDGFHHSNPVKAARRCLDLDSFSVLLGEVVEEVFEPNRGARIKVEDPRFGVPFLSSTAVFQLDPTGEYLISRKTPHFGRLLVTDRDLLLPRSGQIGGIIGRAVLPLPTYYGSAATEHLVRVRCKTRDDAYYLWAIFASQPGYYAAVGTAYGSSIPSLDCTLLSKLRIPWIDGDFRSEVVDLVSKKVLKLKEAIEKERHAVQIVENNIAVMEAA